MGTFLYYFALFKMTDSIKFCSIFMELLRIPSNLSHVKPYKSHVSPIIVPELDLGYAIYQFDINQTLKMMLHIFSRNLIESYTLEKVVRTFQIKMIVFSLSSASFFPRSSFDESREDC